jgi:uncharacterized protein
MAGWYEISTNDAGQHTFVLKAGNSEVILRSEQYESRAACDKGIASVQTNAADEARYDRKVASDGRPYFTLKAANHQVIGMSQFYSSDASRDKGIASVQANGATTEIVTV